MAAPHTFFERAKLACGVALVAVGMFILYQHLSQTASYLSHFLCTNQRDVPGPLPAVIMAAVCVVQAHATGHQGVLQILVKQLVISFWPVLLVMAGSLLSKDSFDDDSNSAQKKILDLSISQPGVRRQSRSHPKLIKETTYAMHRDGQSHQGF